MNFQIVFDQYDVRILYDKVIEIYITDISLVVFSGTCDDYTLKNIKYAPDLKSLYDILVAGFSNVNNVVIKLINKDNVLELNANINTNLYKLDFTIELNYFSKESFLVGSLLNQVSSLKKKIMDQEDKIKKMELVVPKIYILYEPV